MSISSPFGSVNKTPEKEDDLIIICAATVLASQKQILHRDPCFLFASRVPLIIGGLVFSNFTFDITIL